MEYAVLGWPPDGPELALDHERFRYAGKFRTGDTGVAVAREDDAVVAAVACNDDRATSDALRIRYVTVRDDRQGESIGPRLLRFVVQRASERGYERVRIAVNNPFSYQAAYRAGFAFTGETGATDDLVCEWPAERDAATYRDGLDRFAARDLRPAAAAFVRQWRSRDPPAVVAMP